MSAGTLTVVGLGPGDPDLLTVKAARIVAQADVVAFHRGPNRASIARSIVAELLDTRRNPAIEEELIYPVTTGESTHPLGYHGELADFYLDCARRLGDHLRAGRSVAVLAEGDPFFYGSAMYVHDLLAEEFEVTRVPGVTSMAAATSAIGTGLCRHEDVLTVLPGTLPVPELARRLADTDAAVIMKLGRTFAGVREALHQAGLLERALYIERASHGEERVIPVRDVDAATVPYMSLVIVPGQDRRADSAGRANRLSEPTPISRHSATGTVHVVGLGPGPDSWLSPEASDVLTQVSHVVGYAPYVARVPQRPGLMRHASGNTVEVDRGALALELAAAGDDVAVVSGGDAGVFGMASAVFEAREASAMFSDIPVHVVPGITAAHAASALAGAALGADHALISLSDRLKPWDVIEARLRACARADFAMAFYNPRSNARPHQFGDALTVLREELPPSRCVVVARHVGREAEELHVTTLGDLDPESIDMGCLVIVGAQSTRITADGRVWTPRFVR